MSGFIEHEVYEQLARIGKVLANPVRLRLLDLLDRGESDVESLTTASGVGLKNTSAQLQHLRAANLVITRRQGNRIYYRLAGPEVSHLVAALQSCAEARLADLRVAIGNLLGDHGGLAPVTVDELRAHIDDPGILLIDVRSAEEYANGHLPGAVSFPAAELEAKIDSIPRDVEVIAYCQGPYCVLAPDMARLLRDHHISARPLDGGITRWRRKGGTVQPGERDTAVPSAPYE
ncbi:metalloregulator ArsR/SmtB family transcription factor [Micromonospora sp. NPDC006766]|uniref:ArsR/SmtB family transcription factor n=1 Tax=Micromonospora sp. NPDC006766 TaxID=3154778 RepID=UPI003400E2AB